MNDPVQTKDNKVKNFGILVSKRNKTIGQTRNMSQEIINEIHIGGLQNFNKCDKFNPIGNLVTDNETILNLLKF